jgi:hypothetical protein
MNIQKGMFIEASDKKSFTTALPVVIKEYSCKPTKI